MMAKGGTRESESQLTEHVYLDGIKQMAKGLKDYTAEIDEVF